MKFRPQPENTYNMLLVKPKNLVSYSDLFILEGMHWVTRDMITCPRVYYGEIGQEKRCPICELARQEPFKLLKCRTRVLTNIWFTSENLPSLAGVTMKWSMTMTIYQKMIDILNYDDLGLTQFKLKCTQGPKFPMYDLESTMLPEVPKDYPEYGDALTTPEPRDQEYLIELAKQIEEKELFISEQAEKRAIAQLIETKRIKMQLQKRERQTMISDIQSILNTEDIDETIEKRATEINNRTNKPGVRKIDL